MLVLPEHILVVIKLQGKITVLDLGGGNAGNRCGHIMTQHQNPALGIEELIHILGRQRAFIITEHIIKFKGGGYDLVIPPA
ncbi:hypothetical protein SDC9_201318 [bioreactor metagenome]|uniref:Uncharacterized protein n=1 Tax=bioreactor metagenome TaxID=1076179 RepID=A0A645IZI4_9ZZZZ